MEWSVGQFNDLLDETCLGPAVLCSCLVGIDAFWTVGELQSLGTTLYLVMQLLAFCNRLLVLISGMSSEGNSKIHSVLRDQQRKVACWLLVPL